MQAEILEPNPDANLQVYAVWFNVLPSDSQNEWDDSLLTDPRVRHYWDEERLVGPWFATEVGFSHGALAWDVYYLYGPEAVWLEEPEPLLGSGYTLFGQRTRLLAELEPFYSE